MPPTDEARQRAYYQATADSYQKRHVGEQVEHDLALELQVMLARHHGVVDSLLDVGAGTGRAMKTLATAFPQARVQGIEPVAELRQEAAIQNGISGDDLLEGDALQLPFADDSFDWAVETGVLHHIRHWPQAVVKMARVARDGVLFSNTNNIGQGSPRTRKLKKAIKNLGLWNTFEWLQTKGKMSKWSEGDGVYYSFCACDADLLSAASHLAIVARRQAA
jgi:ubiquinone/menaquinone biosynthesis C-methylase UbiE